VVQRVEIRSAILSEHPFNREKMPMSSDLAALLSISDGLWEIQANHISLAIRVITETREDGASIFEGTGTNTRLVLAADAIRDKLLAVGMGGLKQGDLTKSLQGRANADEIRTILNIMHDLGMVQRFEKIQVGRGRPVTIWRALQSYST
jgi:hypothetical protein